MRQGGMSLIEVVVTLAIAAILLGIGLQSFRGVMESTHSRSTAESILSGLRTARTEAIRRNLPVRFQLVSTFTSACDYSSSSPLWIISQTDYAIAGTVTIEPADGKSHGRVKFGSKAFCDASPYNPPDRPDPCNPVVGVGTNPGDRPVGNPATCSDDPWIIAKSAPTVRSTISVSSSSSIVTFGPLGQVRPNIESVAATPIPSLRTVTVTPSTSDAKRWRITIHSISGTIKMCDPDLTDTANAMFCPDT